MAKGEYTVEGGAGSSPADTSFRSCVIAILIFIFLSLVLILMAIGIDSYKSAGRDGRKKPVTDAEDISKEGKLQGEKVADDDIETLAKTQTRRPTGEEKGQRTTVPPGRSTSKPSERQKPPLPTTVTAKTKEPTTDPLKEETSSWKLLTVNPPTETTHAASETSQNDNFTKQTKPPIVTTIANAASKNFSMTSTSATTFSLSNASFTTHSGEVKSTTSTVKDSMEAVRDTTVSPSKNASTNASDTIVLIEHQSGNTTLAENTSTEKTVSEPHDGIYNISETTVSTSTKVHQNISTEKSITEPHAEIYNISETTMSTSTNVPQSTSTENSILEPHAGIYNISDTPMSTSTNIPQNTSTEKSVTERQVGVYIISDTTTSTSTDVPLHPASVTWTESTGTSLGSRDKSEPSTTVITTTAESITSVSKNDSSLSAGFVSMENATEISSEPSTTSQTSAERAFVQKKSFTENSVVSEVEISKPEPLTTSTTNTVNMTEQISERNNGSTTATPTETVPGTVDRTGIAEHSPNDTTDVSVTTSRSEKDTHVYANGTEVSQAEDASPFTPTVNQTTSQVSASDLDNSTVYRSTTASPTIRRERLRLALTNDTDTGPSVCTTDACYRQAASMVSMMNHTVTPCQDFYKFACGGLQTNPLLQQQDPRADAYQRIQSVVSSTTKPLSAAVKKLQQFQKSCNNYENDMSNSPTRLDEVRKILDNIGNISFNSADWKDYRAGYTDLFTRLLKYNSSPLFDILLDVETKDQPKFVFKLIAPLQGGSLFAGDVSSENCLPHPDIFKNESYIELNGKYDEYGSCKMNVDGIIDNTLKLIEGLGYINGADENATEVLRKSLRYSIDDMYSYINDVGTPAVKRQKLLSKTYETFTVDDLDKTYNVIYWKKLLSNLVEDYHGDIGSHTVQVYFPEYFSYMFSDIYSKTRRLVDFAKDTNNALVAMAAWKLYTDLGLTHGSCDHVKYCQYVTFELMGEAASQAYLQSFSAEHLSDLRSRVKKTFDELKDTVGYELRNAKWLDTESQTLLLSHLNLTKLAEYDWEAFLLNDSYVDSLYEKFQPDPHNYIQNAINLVHLNKKRSYSLYLKDPCEPKHIWSHFKYPFHAEGIVVYALNMIVIPVGLLAKPSNDGELPKYINMASEGLVIAHELAHIFDLTGLRDDMHKNDLKMSSSSSLTYDNMKQCLDMQYSFKVSHSTDGKVLDFRTSSELSNNERMADYTGIMLAYATYQRLWGKGEPLLPFLTNLSTDQLFFLHAAQELCSKQNVLDHFIAIFEDEHLPPAIRVKNMMSNSEDFIKAYNCGSKWLNGIKCEPFPRLSNNGDDIN